MKDKFSSIDVGMRLGRRMGNHQGTSKLSPTNHQGYSRSWQVIFSFLLVLAMSIGNVWAETTVDATLGTRDSISTDGKTRGWDLYPASITANANTSTTGETHNDIYVKASSSGKQKFTYDSGLSRDKMGLSSNSSSDIYIPVPVGSAGTISISLYSSSDSRYLQLYKTKDNTAGTDAQRLWSKYNATATSDGKKGPESFTFAATDTTMIGGKAYLHFKDNNTEMKIKGFSVVLTTGTYSSGGGEDPGDDPEPADETAPAFVSSVPANSATNVAVSGTIVLTFDEAIASVDGTKFTITGATKGTVAVDGTDSKKVNVPYSGAENEATVTLSVAAEAVADAAGNKSAALSDISFTTAAAAVADPWIIKVALSGDNGATKTMSGSIGGTAAVQALAKSSPYKLNNDYKAYVALTLSTGYFQVGDSVVMDLSKTGQMYCGTLPASDASAFPEGSTSLGTTTNKSSSLEYFILPSTLPANTSTIYVSRSSSTYNGTLTYMTVYRIPACPTGLSISGETDYTPGDKIELTASLTKGNGDITYQWYKGGTEESNKLEGKTAAKLEIADCVLGDAGDYYCVASKEGCASAVNATAYTVNVSSFVAVTGITINPASPTVAAKSKITLTVDVTPEEATNKEVEWSVKSGSEAYASVNATTGEVTGKAAGNAVIVATATDGSGVYAEKTVVVTPFVCPTSGTVFSLAMNGTKPSSEIKWTNAENDGVRDLSDYCDVVNGTAALVNNSSSNNQVSITTTPALKISNDANGWLKLNLECGLKAGDTIRLNNSAATIVSYTAAKTAGTADTLTSGSYHNIIVPASWADQDELYIYRKGSNLTISQISIIRPVKYEVSFNLHDHGTPIAPQDIVSGGKVTQPQTPSESGWAFGGWYKEATCTNAWDFANDVVSADTELHAKWTVAYSVTYKANNGTEEEDIVDNNASTVADCSFTAPEGKIFNGWKDADNNDVEVGATVSSNLVLTAQWVNKWTVTFNTNGGSAISPVEVVDGNAVAAPTAPTKVLNEFVKWQLSGEDYNFASVVTGNITLDAVWNPLYTAQGTEYSFVLDADELVVGTEPNQLSFTHNTAKSVSANSRMDNVLFSAMSITFEKGETPASGDDFKGLKIKTSGATVKFLVENDSRVTITMGNLSSGCNIAYTNTSAEAQNVALAAKTANAYNVKGGTLVTLTTQGGNTVTLKGIAVSEIPAQSDDATLSDLKVGGTTIAGFDASTTEYYYEMPYGTAKADLPLVTVTVNEEHAVANVQDAKDRPDDTRATIAVTAEDGTTVKYYYVYFYNAPKYGVELIKATHTGAKTASVTGYIGGTADKDTQDGGKLGSNGHYFGIQLTSGKFQAGDVLVIKAAALNGGNAATLYSDKGDTEIKVDGTFDVASKMYIYTLEAEVEKIYLYRKTSACNPTVQYMAVYRYMAPFIENFEIENVDLTISGTNITAEVASSFDVTALTPTIKAWANGEAQIDKTGAQNFTDPVTYTVSSQYAEDATGAYAPVTYTVTITKVTPSATPSITTQPVGANYIEGATIAALSVEAEAEDGGNLTYQWYLGEDAIDGATEATYAPTVSAIGSYSYTCVVTNKKGDKPEASVTSNAAVVVIAEDPACKGIGYGTSRALATNSEVVIDVVTGLKHISSVEALETGKKISGESNLSTVKLGGNAVYYDVYTTEKNIGSISISVTSNSNDETKKYAVIFCSTASYDESKIIGVVEQVSGAGNQEQVINTPEVPLGTKLVRIKRYYKDANNNEYGEGSSSYLYYVRACLVEPAQEVAASVTAEPASANYCPSDAVANLNYTLSMEEGASAAYQWYKGEEAIDGANDAAYLPAEAGVYTCKALVTKTGRLPKQLTSAEATVNFYVATAITAYADAKGDVDAEKTLSVTAEGTNLSYKWQACDAEGVITDETVLSEAATYGVTITAEPQYYLVTVEGACGTETQVVKAEEWVEYPFAHVTGTRTWDWTTAGMGEVATQSGSAEYLMANVSSQVPNTEAFRSDMLYIIGNYANRGSSNKFFQGTQIRFYTEVPGQVSLECRAIHEQVKITINENVIEAARGGSMTPATTPFTVPSGWVTIVFDNISTGQYADEPARVQKIVFTAASDLNPDDANYTRDLQPGVLSTTCLPNGGVIVGASVFEVAYMDYEADGTTPHKIYFDEVVSGEMEAGIPYVVLVNEGSTQMGVFYTDSENKTEGLSRNGLVGYMGEGRSLVENEWFIYNNMFFYVSATDGTNGRIRISNNRAYLNLADIPGYTTYVPAPGRRRMSMGNGSAPKVPTAVDNVEAAEKPVKVLIDGQIFILRGEKMYDATGRLVR